MRIGEVAVVSPTSIESEIFIESICKKLENADEDGSFGRLKINDQLALHFYGINVHGDYSSISWEFLSPKILGYIVIFDWDDYQALQKIKGVLDLFSLKYKAPIIVAAHVENENDIPMPDVFLESDTIQLSPKQRFTFYQTGNSEDAKRVLTNLVDILLEQT